MTTKVVDCAFTVNFRSVLNVDRYSDVVRIMLTRPNYHGFPLTPANSIYSVTYILKFTTEEVEAMLKDIVRADHDDDLIYGDRYTVWPTYEDYTHIQLKDRVEGQEELLGLDADVLKRLLADALGLDVNELDYGWAEGIEDEEEEP